MKLILDQDALAPAVEFAARQLGRMTVPVLRGLKLTAVKKTQQLTIVGFDYEVATTHTLPVEVITGGQVLVPGRLLADIATRLPRQQVHISTDRTRAVVECGRARFTLPLLPLHDYPTLPELPPAAGCVDGHLLAEAVAQTAKAASTDASLPQLTCIALRVDGSELTLSATDRYRMAVRRLPWTPETKAEDGIKVLLSARTLYEAARAVAEADQVQLHLPGSDGLAGLSGADRTMATRLIDGELPDYSRMFPAPEAVTASVRVQTAALAEAVKRVIPVATRNTPVLLDVTDGAVTLTAGSSDDGLGLDVVDAVLDGEPMKVAFNPGFLADGLALLHTDEAQLHLTTPSKPAVLQPATGTDTTPELRYLLMPVRTSDTTRQES